MKCHENVRCVCCLVGCLTSLRAFLTTRGKGTNPHRQVWCVELHTKTEQVSAKNANAAMGALRLLREWLFFLH